MRQHAPLRFTGCIYSMPATAKPSKSAVKRAMRQARQEKRQKQRAEARKRREELQGSSPEPSDKELTSTEVVVVPSPISNALEVPLNLQFEGESESEVELVTPLVPIPMPPVSEPEVPAPQTVLPEDLQKTQFKPESVEQPVSRTEISNTSSSKSAEQFAAEAEKKKKRQNLFQRTVWTLIMIGGFIGRLSTLYVWLRIWSIFGRTVTFGPCLYDPPCYRMPDTCISGSHYSFSPCNDRKRPSW